MFTKSINQKLTTGFALFTACVSLAGSISIPSFARLADRYTPATGQPPVSLAADRVDPVTLYFPYGSYNEDTDIRNAVAKITAPPSLQFVNTGVYDVYPGSPTRPDSENPPAQVSCSTAALANVPQYQLVSSLVSNSEITYGLQSARSASSPSGATTVDRKREKHTGCIRVTLRVVPSVASTRVGQEVQVVFDEDFAQSPDYIEGRQGQADTRPGRQVFRFTFTPAASSARSSSSIVSSSSTSSIRSASSASSASSISSTVSSISSRQSSSSKPPVVVDDTPRSGGPQVLVGLSTAALFIILFIAYRVRKKRLSKIDIRN